ncbi:hypothetical protein PFICI_05363 [Pestalotiopsis fici W106-1]|uniref:NAD(P)-binding domain-containing protein n=1 Tax=Pestalotiopsis fici (strain W106-1 / CGMCC3.15140) TaxID=1229662 RepID=W3XDI8_PESFW|nr:uncharacterized protein PFICI_05363 [Pestalotiopsis fici W106-1]ETS83487.1 hypothetical protein PFICI_05363 [Pestalotiopsis fici W106-1]
MMENSSLQTTIAFLGATGRTGSATLGPLLANKDKHVQLRTYVRSKAKLLRLLPEIENDSSVEIREGQLDNVKNLTECFRGASIIICTVGENQNIPGLCTLQGAARCIVAALTTLQEEDENWSKPRFIMLSAAPENPRFRAAMPAPVLWLLHTAFYYSYADLSAAQDILAAAPQLMSLLLVQPPGIVEDEPTGHEISTESVRKTVTYADLGSAFAELALERAYDELHAVGVSSKGGDVSGKYEFELLSRMVIGLFAGYMPGYWPAKRFIDRIRGALGW